MKSRRQCDNQRQMQFASAAFCVMCYNERRNLTGQDGRKQRGERVTKLYDAGNHILIRTGYADPAEHRHMAAHIVIGMHEQLEVCLGADIRLCRGVMIPSDVPHRISTNGKPALVFLYDSTTGAARQIERIQALDEEACTDILRLYAEMEREDQSDDLHHEYDAFERCVMSRAGLQETLCSVTDERIAAVMQHIREKAPDGISCAEAARIACLSPGRFSHLFKAQAGMTFAAYVVYQRIMHVYANILQGKSITEAALSAGFSSSSHFADVNRRVFGMSASSITQDLEFIKVR